MDVVASSVAKITFVVAKIIFKVVVITSSVVKITFVVAEIPFKVAVITSPVVKIIWKMAPDIVKVITNIYTIYNLREREVMLVFTKKSWKLFKWRDGIQT